MKKPISKAFKKSIYFLIFDVFFLILFISCSTDPISCLNGSWIEDVSTDLEAFTTASNNYAENPTIENCNSYKSSLNSYINALEDVEDCYGGLADFDGDFDDAKQELSEIDCTEN